MLKPSSRSFAMFAIGTLVLLPAARAGEQGDPAQSCDGGTLEMIECLQGKTAEWDRRMNTAYQQALKDAGAAQREQLRIAQRLWIRYRDADCLYYDMGEAPSPGSERQSACAA
ncbi:lysozyme inhibitor LprI family protein [Bradyrhizobium sp.]|uniref:lysozyme inhibitor LprI family protein n=1 Tax=Bradyrhizobium sp. TaxID=376 RepID=UPI003C327766